MTWMRDFVRFGSPLFVVPLVLAFYTAEEQTFYFWIGILSAFAIVADVGISSVVVRATSYFNAGATQIPKNKKEFDETPAFQNKEPNLDGILELFRTTQRIYLILSLFVIVMLTTGGVAAFWNLMSQSGHRLDLWAAYGTLVVYFGIYMLNVRWSSFMKGLDFIASEARFVTLTTAIRIAIWIILLTFKIKPIGLTLALLMEGVAMHIYYRIFIMGWFKKHGITHIKSGRFNKQLFLSLWPASWRMGGIQLGNFLVERGNNILILQITDTALMANFTFTTWLLKSIYGFSLTPVYSRLPVIFKFAAEKNFKELRRTTGGYMFLGLSMAAITYILFALFGNPILEALNVDRRLMYPMLLFIIMALTEFLDLHSSFHAGVYTSTNHVPFFWPSIISGAVIFFVGLYYALPAFGVVGIIYTRFIAQLCFNNWYAMTLNLKFLSWPFLSFLIEMPKFGLQYIYSKIGEFVAKK